MGKPRSKAAAEVVVARKKKRRSTRSEPSNNPFEVRINRRKHDVLGQKFKSGRGLPGVARSRAVQKRRKTLLLEYQSRHKTGRIVDQRFGEYDGNLSIEEKAAQRFLLEKKRHHKRSGIFNLEDDDDEGGLTHFGQALGDMEKFDDVRVSDESAEEEDIGETHFGGFLRKKRPTSEHASDVPKTRKEIMNEVVAKSKQMKYERQSAREKAEELMDTLDTQWKDIRGLVMQSNTPTPAASSAAASTAVASSDSDYDRAVRELLYERRAQATDRLKSEEEMAREGRETLIKMEADRVRRMRGEVRIEEETETREEEEEKGDGGEEEEEEEEEEESGVEEEEGEEGESGEEEEEVEEGEIGEEGEVGETEVDEEEEEEGEGGEEEEEGEGGEEEEEGEGGEEEGDPAEQFGSDLESDEDKYEDSGVNCSSQHSQENLSEVQREAIQELPYTFKVPASLPDLLALTAGRSPEECVTVVERIYSCHHPSLSPDNRHIMEKFFEVLLSYCCHLGKECTRNGLQTLNKMTSPLFIVAQLNSLHTARVFRKHLSRVYKIWKAMKTKQFPPFEHVVLFWLVAAIFPCSDFKHPITTPAMMLMGQILAKSSVRTYRDLTLGLLLCEILVNSFIQLSKRFIPELVNFLCSCTAFLCTHNTTVLYPPFTSTSKLRPKMCSSISKWTSSTSLLPLPSVLRLVMQHEEGGDEEDDPVISASIIASCLQLILKLCHLYRDLPSFPEIFSTIASHLEHVPSNLPEEMKTLVHKVLEGVANVTSTPRPVLQLLKRKPKSIKFYDPSYVEIYDVRKRRTQSKSVNERQKLRYKVKMERKGAIRELKKDAHFLSREKLKDSRKRDAERERKTRKIIHDLQNMQHEMKMVHRKKI